MGRSLRLGASIAAILAVPTLAQAEDTLSLRAWYFYDELSSGEFVSNNGAQNFSLSSAPFEIPMFGAAYTHRGLFGRPNTSITLTALYGKSNQTLRTRGANVNTLPDGRQQLIFSYQEADQDLDRLDLEAVLQVPINDFLSINAGARHERVRIDYTSTVTNISSNPFTGAVNQPPPFTTGTFTGGYDLTSVRAGVTMNVPLVEDAKHLLYGSAFGFVGQRWEYNDAASPILENATLAGPDIALGYVYRINDRLSLDARYRAIVFYELRGGVQNDVPKVTHGVNVGVNLNF